MATFDYTSRDYLSIRQDLINRAALLIPEWNGDDASEFGNVFIDLWAYMGDVLHFYIDRAASETFLDTATQRESVMAIANLMDYSPVSSRAARGTCTIKLTSFPNASVKSHTISSATVSSGVVTFTTTSNHDLTSGQLVTVSGMSPSAFNISDVVISGTPTPTTFTLLTSQYTSAPSGSSTVGGTLEYNLAYTVPQYTVFNAYDATNTLIDYYLSSAVTFTQTNVNAVASLVQGKIIFNESVGTSSGRPNQSFRLMKPNVDTDSITVEVYEGPLSGGSPTAVTYQYYPYLSTAKFSDKVFTTKLTSDGYTQIIFGNSFNGYIPSTNASIYVSYRTTVGSDGNINANRIQFISGTPSSYVTIVSSGAFTGGANVESIESIRSNVSRLFRTQDRAVSLQDYKDLTLQIPGVSKATAVYGKSNAISVNGTVSAPSVTFTSATPHGFAAGQKVTITAGTGSSYLGTDLIIESVPSTTQFVINTASYGTTPTGTTTGATATAQSTAVIYPVPHLSSYPPLPITSGTEKVIIEIPTPMVESIESYFSTRSMLGVTASVINPTNHGTIDKYIECTPVYVGMQVYVKDNYVQSWIKSEVSEAIRALLTFENVNFGQTLTVGEVYRAALSVNGVDYVVLTNLSTTYDSTPATVSTVANVSADSNKLLCFTDKYTSNGTSNAIAVNLAMSGGITGSN